MEAEKISGPESWRGVLERPWYAYMGVSKNRGTQNGWFIMENPIKIDDLGVFPYFWKHPYIFFVDDPKVENPNIP